MAPPRSHGVCRSGGRTRSWPVWSLFWTLCLGCNSIFGTLSAGPAWICSRSPSSAGPGPVPGSRPAGGPSHLTPGCRADLPPFRIQAREMRRRGLQPVAHGPSGIFDDFLRLLVPQPGPEWIPEPAVSEAPSPIPEGLDEAETAWRRFLFSLIPQREGLMALAQEAEEDMRRPVRGDVAGAVSLAERSVHRAVWANLGPAVRAALTTMEGMNEGDAQDRAAAGAFERAKDHCTDVAGLASAIHGAWEVAALEPEDLWAAQLLLGECRRRTGSSPHNELFSPCPR
uniref:Uncharacterized protein n=1 Tax=Alexandrium monilatum TaxID=311494 RepID=A0A7S4PU37_9DINO